MDAQVQRGVDGNTIFSTAMPKIRIELDPAMRYIGAQSFALKGIAQAEIYYFAEAVERDVIRSFLVQFEHFLPNNTHTYTYNDGDIVQLGAHTYLTDARMGNYRALAEASPESDLAQGVWLYVDKGFHIESLEQVMRQRFVRVVDDERRTEILFVYTENLRPFGVILDDLKDSETWATLQKSLLERALASFHIVIG